MFNICSILRANLVIFAVYLRLLPFLLLLLSWWCHSIFTIGYFNLSTVNPATKIKGRLSEKKKKSVPKSTDNLINIYELISVCSWTRNAWMISEAVYSSQTKFIGLNLHVSEHGIGYWNLTPDPQGARGAPGVKIQVSPNQKTSLTKVVRHNKRMIKVSLAPPEELGKPAKRVS